MTTTSHSNNSILNSKELKERNTLIENNLSLVNRTVDRLGHIIFEGKVSKEDLISAGMIGLVDAADKYQSEKGSFEGFAKMRIKGAILDYLRGTDNLSRNARKNVKELNKAIIELEKELGRTPADKEITAYLQITQNKLHEIQKDSAINTLSLNQCFDESSDEIGDTIADQSQDLEEFCERTLLRERLAKVISLLPQKEKTIIGLYHFRKLNMKKLPRYSVFQSLVFANYIIELFLF